MSALPCQCPLYFPTNESGPVVSGRHCTGVQSSVYTCTLAGPAPLVFSSPGRNAPQRGDQRYTWRISCRTRVGVFTRTLIFCKLLSHSLHRVLINQRFPPLITIFTRLTPSWLLSMKWYDLLVSTEQQWWLLNKNFSKNSSQCEQSWFKLLRSVIL